MIANVKQYEFISKEVISGQINLFQRLICFVFSIEPKQYLRYTYKIIGSGLNEGDTFYNMDVPFKCVDNVADVYTIVGYTYDELVALSTVCYIQDK